MKKASVYSCVVLYLFNDIVAQMLYNPEFVGDTSKQYTEEEMTTLKKTCVAEMAKLSQSTSKFALFILIYFFISSIKICKFVGLFYLSSFLFFFFLILLLFFCVSLGGLFLFGDVFLEDWKLLFRKVFIWAFHHELLTGSRYIFLSTNSNKLELYTTCIYMYFIFGEKEFQGEETVSLIGEEV